LKISEAKDLTCRCQVGLLPLPSKNSNEHSFLVFGGLQHYKFRPQDYDNTIDDDPDIDLIDDIFQITINREDPEKNQLKKIDARLQIKDRIYHNQWMVLETDKQIYGCASREGFHVFNAKDG
jgi:hypothetical protein